jgi:hypothetical protein
MMDFSTRCLKKRPKQPWAALGLWLCGFFLSWAVWAGEAEIRSVALTPSDDFYILDTDVALELTPQLEDVVSRGVPLYFVAEFELSRRRWYWLDEKVAEKTLVYRLSYSALTRQYRLTSGVLHQNFASLHEALRTLTRIRNWGIIERNAIKPGENYNARVRFRLDMTQLPKPFQVSALGNRDWNVATDWLNWIWVAPK